MNRGDVYTLGNTKFPDGTVRAKHAVFVCGQHIPGTNGNGQVSVVIANTDRRKLPRRPAHPYEAELGVVDGFAHDTLIDCRWVPVKTWDELQKAQFLLTLNEGAMRRIDRAIYEGLQLDP